MAYDIQLRWTNQAINDLEEVLDYLEENWTEKEINNFKRKLGSDLELLKRFPYLGPASISRKYLRKFILNKHVTIVYQYETNSVTIISLFQNAKNPKY